ncbi:MAG: hypothetical protein ACRDVM_01400 [Acidimicrobiia bacterium]
MPAAALRELAARQYGLVGRAQARQLGMGKDLLRRRIDRGELRFLTPEVLEVVGAPPSDGQSAMAALLDAPPGAVLSHTSAAAWWGLPGFDLRRDLHVTVPRQGAPRRGRLAMMHYQKDLPTDHLMVLRGVPVTSPALTIFHLAALLHPKRAARACDNAWAMRLLDGATLHRLLHRLAASGRNGIGPMRQILADRPIDYVPPESGVEARYLQLIVEDGMPAPRRQVDLGGRFWVGRGDFLFEDVPGVVEILSARFHASYLDRSADEERFAAYRAAGLSVLAIWDYEIWHHPREVVEKTRRFRAELLTGAAPVLAPQTGRQ